MYKYEKRLAANDDFNNDKAAAALRAPMIIATRSGLRKAAEKTHWPRLGNIQPEAFKQNDQFGTDEFLSQYVPGDDVYAYGCGCEGLSRLARAFHLPLYKFAGLTQVPTLLVRQQQINKDRYGAWHLRGHALAEEKGFQNYEMQTCEMLFGPHANSPVSSIPRGLRITLPRSMSFVSFDLAIRSAIRRSSLNTFAASPAGRAHFALLGVDPRSIPRFTGYRFGSETRFDAAQEILICRPREDFSRLALIAEDIILSHVMSLAPG